ncbi:unnamed protein product [marine sediment metagenome]|uniref:Uncharacterized protein n=1 Tax=marine sediment metagenome TaxID=412755 RepID=X1BU08_9ZZZZ
MSEHERIDTGNELECCRSQIREWRQLVSRHLPPTDCDRDDVQVISDRISELEVMESKLPVDKLGNRVVPHNDPMWRMLSSGSPQSSTQWIDGEPCFQSAYGGLVRFRPDECFSTEAASLAAKEGETDA